MLKTGLYSQHDVDLMKNHLNVISKVSDIWTLGECNYHKKMNHFHQHSLQGIPHYQSDGRLRSTKANPTAQGYIVNIYLPRIR